MYNPSYKDTLLHSIPGRDLRPNTDYATCVRAAQRRIAALRDAGLPTMYAEQALAKLEARDATS
jgi:hypothetical protein